MKTSKFKGQINPLVFTLVILAGFFLGVNLVTKPTLVDSDENNTTELSTTFDTDQVTIKGNDDQDTKTMPIYGNWTSYTKEDGLPDNKVYCVRVDGDRVWAGTNNGLGLLENGKWKTFRVEDGLAHNGVLCIDVSPLSGDVWIATLAGLNRYSAGKFEEFNQFNSGLANDVIYTVICDEEYVWVATGGGAGSYNTYTKQWGIYTEQNAPMHEPWTYGVCAGGGKVYIAAWGGGVIEYNKSTGKFRDHVDPDGQMEIDLFADDGVVHDITTGVTYANDILWVATYFGISRYDGAHWKGYFDDDSGLISNFTNYTKANGPIAWFCTDDGISSFNGETWVSYQRFNDREGGNVIITEGDREPSMIKKVTSAPTSISNNFVIGVDFKDDVLWVATSKGLSRGEVIGEVDVISSKR